jgi:hypothetical protein
MLYIFPFFVKDLPYRQCIQPRIDYDSAISLRPIDCVRTQNWFVKRIMSSDEQVGNVLVGFSPPLPVASGLWWGKPHPTTISEEEVG